MGSQKVRSSFLAGGDFDPNASYEEDDDVGFFIDGEEPSLPSEEYTMAINFNDEDESSLSKTSSSPQQQQRRSILKANVNEPIPVCTHKKSWLTMPRPDLEKIKMKRVESLSSFFHQEPETAAPEGPRRASDTVAGTMKRTKSSVCFQDITVREYDVTVGDNPSVTSGPPVSLDWNYEEAQPMGLNDYEDGRVGFQRSRRQMAMGRHHREQLLMDTWGHSAGEVKRANEAAKRAKAHRAITRSRLQYSKIEEIGESLGRKIKRTIKRNKSAGCLNELSYDNASMKKSTSAGSLTRLAAV